jgi:predicted porin
MKKSLIALAVLGFASAASAQSSVTMYGRVDLSVGKPIGTAEKGMFNGSGSRLGMRGSEDLGGGLKGIFQIETRFDADTGGAQNFNQTPRGATAATGNRFWGARSIVGVAGGFGQVVLGREYSTAFLGSQLVADPWGWDTVAASVTSAITGGGGIAKVRNDSAVTYTAKFGGVSLGAQIAEATDTFTNRAKRPFNFNVGFGGGPVSAHFGYEAPGDTSKWTSVGVDARFGAFKPGIFFGTGKAADRGKHQALMLTGVGYFGAGELRLAVGKLDRTPVGGAKFGVVSAVAVGYHHSLSKRTTVYADFARNGKAAVQKTGYDFGLKHNF